MREEDAEQKAEKPERNRKVGGGTAEDTTSARQALTARGDKANDEASLFIEEVLCRENMMKAHKRVVANGGAPGVDGITVDELIAYCREHWSRIREEIRSGEYHPAPVRKGRDTEAGRKRNSHAGYPNGAGANDPTSPATGSHAAVRAYVLEMELWLPSGACSWSLELPR